MIMLRRNDKIIIIVGVLILVAAGVGVAIYAPPPAVTPPPTQPTQTTYQVSWTEKTGKLEAISDYAAKNTPYNMTFKIDQPSISVISFHLTWKDDRAFLRRFGLDTLTLDITTPNDRTATFSQKSMKKTKAGDFTINITGVEQPTVTTITGNSTSDASTRLHNALLQADPWAGKSFNATVTVTIGEKILKFRDKGNSFTLSVNYTYYDYSIGTMGGTGGDDLNGLNPPDTTSYTPPYMSMILNTGCGRFV